MTLMKRGSTAKFKGKRRTEELLLNEMLLIIKSYSSFNYFILLPV